MALLDHLTPTYYKVLRMSINLVRDEQTEENTLVVRYLVRILNAGGHEIETMYIDTTMTEAERTAVMNRYLSDKAGFETTTGLTEWEE